MRVKPSKEAAILYQATAYPTDVGIGHRYAISARLGSTGTIVQELSIEGLKHRMKINWCGVWERGLPVVSCQNMQCGPWDLVLLAAWISYRQDYSLGIVWKC